MYSKKLIFSVLTILCSLGLALCAICVYPKVRPNPASADNPNVIIISIDTLGAQHLGAYGYERNTSPNIDNFAKENTVFKNAFTPVPCTTPSYASLLTGLYSTTHGSYYHPLDKRYSTLAQNFQDIGYNTAAFYSNRVLDDKIGGLGRGFKTYDGVDKYDTRIDPSSTYGVYGSKFSLQKGQRTTEETKIWLKKNSKNKFFLLTQYADPHLPYGQADPYKDMFVTGDKNNPLANPDRQQEINQKNSATPEDNQYLMDKYDENIAYVDNQVGELINYLKDQGLYDNSMIVLTADHGESFDHGALGHCWQLYDSTTRIPLVIHEPGKTKTSSIVNDVVSLIDIYPTLAARFNFKTNNYKLDGVDISPTLLGTKLSRKAIYSVSNALPAGKDRPLSPNIKFTGRLYEKITESSRMIYNQNSGKTTAFNVLNDPGEINDIFSDDLKRDNEELILWSNKNQFENNIVEQSNDIYESLQGLGYLN